MECEALRKLKTHTGFRCRAGRYQITGVADGLVRLMHETLAEACASRSAAVVQLAAGAVRDAAALLVALPPVTRSKELQVRISCC